MLARHMAGKLLLGGSFILQFHQRRRRHVAKAMGCVIKPSAARVSGHVGKAGTALLENEF